MARDYLVIVHDDDAIESRLHVGLLCACDGDLEECAASQEAEALTDSRLAHRDAVGSSAAGEADRISVRGRAKP